MSAVPAPNNAYGVCYKGGISLFEENIKTFLDLIQKAGSNRELSEFYAKLDPAMYGSLKITPDRATQEIDDFGKEIKAAVVKAEELSKKILGFSNLLQDPSSPSQEADKKTLKMQASELAQRSEIFATIAHHLKNRESYYAKHLDSYKRNLEKLLATQKQPVVTAASTSTTEASSAWSLEGFFKSFLPWGPEVSNDDDLKKEDADDNTPSSAPINEGEGKRPTYAQVSARSSSAVKPIILKKPGEDPTDKKWGPSDK